MQRPKPCHAFSLGSCRYGSGCRNSHILCKSWQASGTCPFGDNCNFVHLNQAHSSVAPRFNPNTSSIASSSIDDKSKQKCIAFERGGCQLGQCPQGYSHVTCCHYARGACNKGTRCSFVHRIFSAQTTAAPKKCLDFENRLCVEKGPCPKGLSHIMCDRFQSGDSKCLHGQHCHFIHRIITISKCLALERTGQCERGGYCTDTHKACPAFMKGNCSKEAKECNYIHRKQLPPMERCVDLENGTCTRKPCNFSHKRCINPLFQATGVCSWGASCRFVHRGNATKGQLFVGQLRHKCKEAIKEHRQARQHAETQIVKEIVALSSQLQVSQNVMEKRKTLQALLMEIREHFAKQIDIFQDVTGEIFKGAEKLGDDVDGLKGKMFTCQIDREVRRLLKRLPMYAYRQEIMKAVANRPVALVVGKTGSGKSTQLCQYLAENPLTSGIVLVTQPRSVAALSLAERVAEEWGCELGQEVGVITGNLRKNSDATRILFVTEHIYLQMFLQDRSLKNYSVVIIDEAHQRTVLCDIALAVTKGVLPKRPDLRLIISSATIDAAAFAQYFKADNLSLIDVPGSLFPVDIVYSPNPTGDDDDYFDRLIDKVVDLHVTEQEGHMLVFLTSQAEIEEAAEAIRNACSQNSRQSGFTADVLPMFGKLPLTEQRKIFLPAKSGVRKIILATNTAETSITIDGVRFVVDCGFSKEKLFNARRNVEELVTRRIPKSSAVQRAGRAGRTASGKCIRMYSQDTFEAMPFSPVPEIQNSMLSMTVLRLYTLGFVDPMAVEWLSSPDAQAVLSAQQTLTWLGAIDRNGITKKGRQLLELGIDPCMGAMILKGIELQVGKEVVAIASMLSYSDKLMFRFGSQEQKKKTDVKMLLLSVQGNDFMTYLHIFQQAYDSRSPQDRTAFAFKHKLNANSLDGAVAQFKVLRGILKRLKVEADFKRPFNLAAPQIHEAIIAGFFPNLCYLSSLSKQSPVLYLPLYKVTAVPHSSTAFLQLEASSWAIFAKFMTTADHSFVFSLAPINSSLLQRTDLVPSSFFKEANLELEIGRACQKLTFPCTWGDAVVSSFNTSHKGRKALENECGSSVFIDNTLKILEVWAPVNQIGAVRQIVENFEARERERIKTEQKEVVIRDQIRALLKAGGTVQKILVENEFVHINVNGLPYNMQEADFERLFSTYGKINIYRFFASTTGERPWGSVRYEDPEAAQRALSHNGQFIEHRFARPDWREPVALKVTPGGEKVAGAIRTEVRLRFTWVNGISEGYGFLKYPKNREKQMPRIYQALNDAGLIIGGQKVSFSPPGQGETSLKIKNLHPSVHEAHINLALQRQDSYLLPKNVVVMRGKDPSSETNMDTDFGLAESLAKLYSLFTPFHATSIDLGPMLKKRQSMKEQTSYTALVTFPDSESAHSAQQRYHMQEDVFGTQIVELKSDVIHKVWFNRRVFKNLSKVIESILAVKAHYCIVDKKEKENIISLKLISSRSYFQDISPTKNALDQLLKGEAVYLDPAVCKALTAKGEKEQLRELENHFAGNLSISTVSKFLRINVCGTPEARKEAIQHLLKKTQSAIKRCVSIKRGGLKELLGADGKGLQKLTDRFRIEFDLNIRQHMLYFYANDEAYQQVLKHVNGLSVGTKSSNSEAECIVCFCDVTEPYVLSACGHVGCKVCIKAGILFGIANTQFPIKCPCSELVTLQDMWSLLSSEELDRLLASSLNNFLQGNKQYKNCFTPDCVPCRVDLKDNSMSCSVCKKRYCANCEVSFHEGMSCMAYKKSIEEHNPAFQQYLKLWTKKCPGCGVNVEKDKGCNHMICFQCNCHFCWLCGEAFADTKRTYAHLNQRHGGIFQMEDIEY